MCGGDEIVVHCCTKLLFRHSGRAIWHENYFQPLHHISIGSVSIEKFPHPLYGTAKMTAHFDFQIVEKSTEIFYNKIHLAGKNEMSGILLNAYNRTVNCFNFASAWRKFNYNTEMITIQKSQAHICRLTLRKAQRMVVHENWNLRNLIEFQNTACRHINIMNMQNLITHPHIWWQLTVYVAFHFDNARQFRHCWNQWPSTH